jgi:hypothetical protein
MQHAKPCSRFGRRWGMFDLIMLCIIITAASLNKIFPKEHKK